MRVYGGASGNVLHRNRAVSIVKVGTVRFDRLQMICDRNRMIRAKSRKARFHSACFGGWMLDWHWVTSPRNSSSPAVKACNYQYHCIHAIVLTWVH